MHPTANALLQRDWPLIARQLQENGYVIIPQALTQQDAQTLSSAYHESTFYRKTIVMARYRFGLGEYKYFRYPLPPLLQSLRETLYARIAPVANKWMEQLETGISYPGEHAAFLERCRANGQELPAVLILQYETGGFNTLHQDLYGDVYFPIQAVLFLDEAGKDYTGGEFVLTEQVPRAQSKAIVLQPGKGDILLFTTQFRPLKGSRGFYRAHMKHGVSALRSGHRHTLGIIFHDAAT
ncbi:2OG-Fe(II) oxygenase [Chitinophaga caseinilytica]|uniref:2OG-Fe(II) oxygenase n=1 Tax=Chitinophaga caseinilytica TaxID=2267521 RepID=UPI003C2AF490